MKLPADGIPRAMTAEAVAAEMGISKQAVLMIERRALKKLQKRAKALGLRLEHLL